jgi:hypothetical protein
MSQLDLGYETNLVLFMGLFFLILNLFLFFIGWQDGFRGKDQIYN